MKVKQFLFAVLLVLDLGCAQSFAQNQHIPLILDTKSNDHSGTSPRLPAKIPISGFVYDGDVYLGFQWNLGPLDVLIMDDAGFPMFHTAVDASEPEAMIPAALGPGFYTILFTTEAAVTYRGSFILY